MPNGDSIGELGRVTRMIAVIVRDDHVVEHGDIRLLQNRRDPVRIARDPRRTRLRGVAAP